MTGTFANASVAVVCGGDTDIGRAIVSRLHTAGTHVVTVDSPGTLPHPDAVMTLRGDIGQEPFWSEVRAALAERALTPSILVHALSGFDRIAGTTAGSIHETFSLTVKSAELASRILIPEMTQGGSVVFIASVLAEWDTRGDAGAFAATQAGLLALARSQAIRGGPFGVRVNAVGAGLVAVPSRESKSVPTELCRRIPLGRPATPDDIADATLFLASPDARHVSGTTLVVDGGQSLQSWSNAPRDGGYPPSPQFTPPAAAATDRFRSKIVLITGAAGGLGSAAARRFAAENAKLALLDRDEATVGAMAREIGDDALPLTVDVANEDGMAKAFARAEDHFGRLDVVLNNAGIGGLDLAVADTPSARWDEMISVNLRGVFLGSKYAVPALRRAGGGAIVNMGSSTGRHDTITGGAAYMASKAGVEAMTKSLALQVAQDGIRANTVLPGIIETWLSFRQQERGDRASFFAEFARRMPLGRVGQPEDVAAAVAFLASDQARHITGASLLIDGGQTLRRWVSAPDAGDTA